MSFIGNRPDSYGYSTTAYEQFSGNLVQTNYILSRSVSANSDIFVTVDNVPQVPGDAYYISNLNTLTFTGAPGLGTNNIVVVYRNYVQSGIAPGANTVTASQIAANTIQPYHLSSGLLSPITDIFIGNGSTSVYALSQNAVSSNSCTVTINGITQAFPSNYSVSGNVLTFTSAPANNSIIKCVQNSIVGTSIVPIDGSVTLSKLSASGTANSNTYLRGDNTWSVINQNSVTGNLTVSGNILSGNITTSGVINTTNLTSSGNITTVNISSGNITTGNISSGNITTSGVINTTNLSASSVINTNHLTASGNISSGNITTSGNLIINGTNSYGYKLLVNGIDGLSARITTTGRADLTLTSSGAISYDIGTNSDSSFSIRQNGTTDFLRLRTNGNISVGSSASSSLTIGTGNITIGTGAGSSLTTGNNNVIIGQSDIIPASSYYGNTATSNQTIIGDSIGDIVYPTYTSFNGTYAIYDFKLNSTNGGLYEISSMVNLNAGGSGNYRCFEKRYVGCYVGWGGAAYQITVATTSLYNVNGANVNAVVIYNANNSTEYTPTYYNASSHTFWNSSGFYLRVKLTNFNTTYIGQQKVILRKMVSD